LVKESGKFVINDLEMMIDQESKAAKMTGKRARMQIAKDHEESDAGSSVGDNVSESENDSGDLLMTRIK
jgi:hypothetical protein